MNGIRRHPGDLLSPSVRLGAIGQGWVEVEESGVRRKLFLSRPGRDGGEGEQMMRFAWITVWLLSMASLPAGEPVPRVTLVTAGEELHTILDAVAEQTGYNLVVPESVSLKVRVTLKEVSLQEALDSILLLNGFHYRIQDRTILVYPAGSEEIVKSLAQSCPLHSRVFDLRHVTAGSVKETVESLLSPRGKVRVIPCPPSQTWERTDNFLYTGTTPSAPARPAGKEAEDQRSQRLIVIDEEPRLDEVGEVLGRLDVPGRQVYVSAVIFEMGLTEEEEVGLRWRLSASISPSSLPWNFPFGNGSLGPFSPHVSPNDDFFPGFGSKTMFPDNAASEFLFGRINLSASDLLLELNRLGSNFNLISNPRLMVADREEAVILVGEKYPLLRSTITDQGTVTETFDRYEPIGVQLRVVPHILENGEVSMLIEPQVTSLGSTVVGTTGLSYPRITTRRVESMISVGDGQSIVIAGLVSEQDRKTVQSLPYLSDIPLLGRLFRHRFVTREKVDLVVIVTPYIDRVPDLDALDREFKKAGIPVKAPRYLDTRRSGMAPAREETGEAPAAAPPAAAAGR